MSEKKTEMYQGFLILEYAPGLFSAYRTIDYYRSGVESYTGESRDEIMSKIDEVGDSGDISEDIYQQEFMQVKGPLRGIRGPVLSTVAQEVEQFGEFYYILVVIDNEVVDWDGHRMSEAMTLRERQMKDRYPRARVIRLQVTKF